MKRGADAEGAAGSSSGDHGKKASTASEAVAADASAKINVAKDVGGSSSRTNTKTGGKDQLAELEELRARLAKSEAKVEEMETALSQSSTAESSSVESSPTKMMRRSSSTSSSSERRSEIIKAAGMSGVPSMKPLMGE